MGRDLKAMLTRRRPRDGKPGVHWLDLEASDLAHRPGLIHSLLRKEFDGMTVRGVMTVDEATGAARRAPDFLEFATPVVFGVTLGRPLLQGGMSQDRTAHLDDADLFRTKNVEIFGFDPHERLDRLLRPAMVPMTLTSPTEGGRHYNPGVIRVMEAGRGGLAAHAGNQFLASNAMGSASHLLETTRAFDHLSYFVMLECPERGGELSVYERLWVDPRDGGGEVDDPLGDDQEFDTLPGIRLAPGPGDLIIFGAGRRWHRVEKVEGSRPRITYGGFAAPNMEDTELQCWS